MRARVARQFPYHSISFHTSGCPAIVIPADFGEDHHRLADLVLGGGDLPQPVQHVGQVAAQRRLAMAVAIAAAERKRIFQLLPGRFELVTEAERQGQVVAGRNLDIQTIGLVRAVPGGMTLSTGVRVIYADEESFSFMTPAGHMFAGIITFSAYDDAGDTVIQIQALIRASDPLF